MAGGRDPYCDRSAALGEGFPDLIGGVLGLAVGLARGSVLAARRLAEDAIWMDADYGRAPSCRARACRCGAPVHRYVISDCGPCPPCPGWQ